MKTIRILALALLVLSIALVFSACGGTNSVISPKTTADEEAEWTEADSGSQTPPKTDVPATDTPAIDPATEAKTEPVTEPGTEPITEPVTEPTVFQITYANTKNVAHDNPTTYTVEDAFTLAPLSFEGYTFDGWYNGGDKVTAISAGTFGDLTLEARWTAINYLITYNVNGGTNNESNPATYTIEGKVPLLDPTRDYYRFLGWYDASETRITTLQGASGDLTLTARWECYFTVNSGAITDVSFYFEQNVTTVALPDALNGVKITAISAKAFDNCTRLTSLTIPDSVTSIGDYAFRGCSGLTSIIISDSVTSIGREAFAYCSGLTSVIWNATNCASTGSSSYPIFSGCSNLTTVTIGENVETIPAYAFSKCSGLTSITIPNSVTSIGNSAFSGCKGLTSITIPNSVTSIGEDAFYGCKGLTSVTIPNSVTSIGEGAFSGC